MGVLKKELLNMNDFVDNSVRDAVINSLL